MDNSINIQFYTISISGLLFDGFNKAVIHISAESGDVIESRYNGFLKLSFQDILKKYNIEFNPQLLFFKSGILEDKDILSFSNTDLDQIIGHIFNSLANALRDERRYHCQMEKIDSETVLLNIALKTHGGLSIDCSKVVCEDKIKICINTIPDNSYQHFSQKTHISLKHASEIIKERGKNGCYNNINEFSKRVEIPTNVIEALKDKITFYAMFEFEYPEKLLDSPRKDDIDIKYITTDGNNIFYQDYLVTDFRDVESCNNTKIQVNTAIKDDLMLFLGIGVRLANNIIKERDSNGLYKDFNDLCTRVKVSSYWQEQIKDACLFNLSGGRILDASADNNFRILTEESSCETANEAKKNGVSINVANASEIKELSPILTIIDIGVIIQERNKRGCFKDMNDFKIRTRLPEVIIKQIESKIYFTSKNQPEQNKAGRIVDI